MAAWTGWMAFAMVLFAACFPIGHRLARGRRAAPESTFMRTHAAIGLGVTAVAFGHTLTSVAMLGEARAIGGGMLALAPGAVAFLILLAHTGVGLQLRRPQLRDRARKRRVHATTAILIVTAVVTHVVVLLRAG
jgi:cytochrome b561